MTGYRPYRKPDCIEYLQSLISCFNVKVKPSPSEYKVLFIYKASLPADESEM